MVKNQFHLVQQAHKSQSLLFIVKDLWNQTGSPEIDIMLDGIWIINLIQFEEEDSILPKVMDILKAEIARKRKLLEDSKIIVSFSIELCVRMEGKQ